MYFDISGSLNKAREPENQLFDAYAARGRRRGRQVPETIETSVFGYEPVCPMVELQEQPKPLLRLETSHTLRRVSIKDRCVEGPLRLQTEMNLKIN